MGALFLGAFATVWLMIWAYRTFDRRAGAAALTGAAGMAALGWIYTRYRRHQQNAGSEPDTPEARRTARLFHIVNFGQWIVIVVVGNILANIGLSAWVLPMVMLVVGLHFFPLARLFNAPSRAVTGVALVLVAILYPFLAPNGPADPVGCLCAGAVLWASAIWSMGHDG